MATYLKQIQLLNFRSCRRTTFAPCPNLSALIGVNGSGKSNLLNGITLLSKILRSRPYYEEPSFQSVCKVKTVYSFDDKTVEYEAVVRYVTNDRNVDEVVNTTEKWNFGEFTGDKSWLQMPSSILSELLKARSSKRPALYEIENLKRFSYRVYREYLEAIPKELLDRISVPSQSILNLVDGITYYSASQFTDPSQCPTYLEIESDPTSRREAALLSGRRRARTEHAQFMYDLFLTYKNNRQRFDEFVSIVGKGGIGLIDKITYKEIEAPSRKYEVYTGGKFTKKEIATLLVIPTIFVKGVQLSPNQLSEGTFRTLAMVFHLVADRSRLLLLEEPEVCIHHGLLGSIMQLVKQFSGEKQIVISTHSDFVLDGLEPDVVFIVKYQTDKGTSVKHVPRAMSAREYKALKEYLNSEGNLGEYWRHGDLEL